MSFVNCQKIIFVCSILARIRTNSTKITEKWRVKVIQYKYVLELLLKLKFKLNLVFCTIKNDSPNRILVLPVPIPDEEKKLT